MNIMIGFNDGFMMPTKVMLTSLIRNNDERLDIYVVYIALSEESIASIRSLADGKRVFVYFVKVDEALFEDVPATVRFPKEAFIRMYAQYILDDRLDRILWLDGDMIISGSLSDYYHQDFEGKIYIATEDQDMGDDIDKKRSLGMPLEIKYVNSGVLLINLQAAREKIKKEEIDRFIKEHHDSLPLCDQDVLNGLLYTHTYIYRGKYVYNYFSRRIFFENRQKIYQNAKIIHYTGPEKPWKHGYPFLGFRLWWKYARMTDLVSEEMYHEMLSSHVKTLTRIGMFLRRVGLVRRIGFSLAERFPKLFPGMKK